MAYQTTDKAETQQSAELFALAETFKASDVCKITRLPWITSKDPPTGIVAFLIKKQSTAERVIKALAVIGDVVVLEITKLDTAKVPEDTVVSELPAVLMFFTAYDTFVYVAIVYPIINAKQYASSAVAAVFGDDVQPVPVDVKMLPAVPGDVKPVPPAAAGSVPAVKAVADVE